MIQRNAGSAKALVLAVFFVCAAAQAAPGLVERLNAIFDTIADNVQLLGRKSEELLGPGLGPFTNIGVQEITGPEVTREYDKNFQLPPGGLVDIAHAFGSIRVETWNERVARITATITTLAETTEAAAELADATEISVDTPPEGLRIRTLYPDFQNKGKGAVDYTLWVPHDTRLICLNEFGDTLIHGVRGGLTLDARYGAVELTDIGGPVRVQSRGDAPLTVSGLRDGGRFTLNRSKGVFRRAGGLLIVDCFMGSVDLGDLLEGADVDVTSQSGPVSVYLDGAAQTSVSAEAFFADVISDLGHEVSKRGNVSLAESRLPEPRYTVKVRSSFGDIHLWRATPAGAPPAPSPAPAPGLIRVTAAKERQIPEGTPLRVLAMKGSVRVEGVDENLLTVEGQKWARVGSVQRAAEAIEALALQMEEGADGIVIRTTATAGMAALGVSDYGVELLIRCPRTSPITIEAQEGETYVGGIGEPVRVELQRGSILAENIKGAVTLINHNGDIRAWECGALEGAAISGNVMTRQIQGAQRITCEKGGIIIDEPQESLSIKVTNGDVRIVALSGIRGPYDVNALGGNVRLAASRESQATIQVNVTDGELISAIRMTGSVEGPQRDFRGVIGDGRYPVNLRARHGDVIID